MASISRRDFCKLFGLGVAVTAAGCRVGAADELVISDTFDSPASPLWDHVPNLTIAPGQSISLAELLKNPANANVRLSLESGPLPPGLTYDPETKCLSAAPDIEQGIVTDLVLIADVDE